MAPCSAATDGYRQVLLLNRKNGLGYDRQSDVEQSAPAFGADGQSLYTLFAGRIADPMGRRQRSVFEHRPRGFNSLIDQQRRWAFRRGDRGATIACPYGGWRRVDVGNLADQWKCWVTGVQRRRPGARRLVRLGAGVGFETLPTTPEFPMERWRRRVGRRLHSRWGAPGHGRQQRECDVKGYRQRIAHLVE